MKFRAIYSVFLITSLAGCSSTQPSQFYLLNEIPPHQLRTVHLRDHPNIGLGPVSFPKYLNQPQIVTRVTCNKLNLNEFHRWAESLDENVTHVIRNNLENMLRSSTIFMYPWRNSDKVDFQIRIEITRFDADELGHVVLATRWQIVQDNDRKVLQTTNRIYRDHINEKYTFNDLACTMSQLLGRLSKDIAHSVSTESAQHKRSEKEIIK